MPAFLTSAGALSESAALWLSTLAAVVVILVTPLVGALSDRWGRKPVLVALGLAQRRAAHHPVLADGQRLGGAGAAGRRGPGGAWPAAVSAVGAVATAEQFPGEGRLSGLALGATGATAIFGGLTP